MNIEWCGIELLDRFILLIEDIEKWLWERGVKQWEPGCHRKELNDLSKKVANGGIIAVKHNSEIVGGCIVTSNVPEIWSDDKTSALYLSSLVIMRDFAGSGLSKRIVKYAIKMAGQIGVKELRLDCWEGNTFLKQFYSDCGFTELPPRKEQNYFVSPFKILIET